MPRNRYTKLVRKSERGAVARQESELPALAREFRHKSACPMQRPSSSGAKEHRRTRLEQKWRHKPERFRAAGAG